MENETVSDEETQAETFQDELQLEGLQEDFQETMVSCPNCKETVPTSLYCLKCGFPLYMFRKEGDVVDVSTQPDEGALGRVQELTKNLMNSISLKLWSVDLLKEGTVDEEHFNRLFDEYQARSVRCMGQRKMLLARYSRELAAKARGLEPIGRALKEVRVNLRELEMRRSISDLLEGEYEAKGPAFRWEIQYYEGEIARRKGEMTFLEDVTKAIPAEEIARMKDKVKEAKGSMETMLRESVVGPETATRVKVSLEETRAFLENFR